MIQEEHWPILMPPKQEAVDLMHRSAGVLRLDVKTPEPPRRKETAIWAVTSRGTWTFDAFHTAWLAEQLRVAVVAMGQCIEVDLQVLGGIPVFKGTRFSVPQFLAELADSDAIEEIAENFEMPPCHLQGFLHALATYLNRPQHHANRTVGQECRREEIAG